MARPSDKLNETCDIIARSLLPFALAKEAGALRAAELATLPYLMQAAESLMQWRRDTTETSRRTAFANAYAAQAVALNAPLQGAATRAIVAYAGAVLQACNGDQWAHTGAETGARVIREQVLPSVAQAA